MTILDKLGVPVDAIANSGGTLKLDTLSGLSVIMRHQSLRRILHRAHALGRSAWGRPSRRPADRGGQEGRSGCGARVGEPWRRCQRARGRRGHGAPVGCVQRESGSHRPASSSTRRRECGERPWRDTAVGRVEQWQRRDRRTTPAGWSEPEPRACDRRHAAHARLAQWRCGVGEIASQARCGRQREGGRERTDGADVGGLRAPHGGRGCPARGRCGRPRPFEVVAPGRALMLSHVVWRSRRHRRTRPGRPDAVAVQRSGRRRRLGDAAAGGGRQRQRHRRGGCHRPGHGRPSWSRSVGARFCSRRARIPTPPAPGTRPCTAPCCEAIRRW